MLAKVELASMVGEHARPYSSKTCSGIFMLANGADADAPALGQLPEHRAAQ
jgi:hypothetical protein